MSIDTDISHRKFIEQSFPTTLPLFPLGKKHIPLFSSCGLTYTIATDLTRSVSRYFNVINSETGSTQRAAFIIDRTRQIRFSFIVQDHRLNHSMHTICNIVRKHI